VLFSCVFSGHASFSLSLTPAAFKLLLLSAAPAFFLEIPFLPLTPFATFYFSLAVVLKNPSDI
jgi:hypothetical protein